MQSEIWTVGKILHWVTERFKEAKLETPRLDAQILLCHVLGVEKIYLYTQIEAPLTLQERTELRKLVKKRLEGEPVAYITGTKHWYDLSLSVDRNVLIPRPETESLVDFIVETAAATELNPQVIFDFCTGSGCIALALAKKYSTAHVIGVDISPQALAMARKNATRNGITNIDFIELDLTKQESFEFLSHQYGQACIITANPPYVSHDEWNALDKSVKNHEPKLALVAENEGLFIGQKIFEWSQEFALLNKQSLFCMEMAENHPQKIAGAHIKTVSFLTTPCQKPRDQWFSLCDLENKARFLCRI
jgi:release factor glutamine methyltransferase